MTMENKSMNNEDYNNLSNRRAAYVDAIREHASDLGFNGLEG